MDCIENDASNNSSLPQERVYLATLLQLQVDRQTDPQTVLWYHRGRRENDGA
jgi:hypothetical protein